MTDQPYTPTTAQVRFAATFPNENFSLKGSDFDRWIVTIEAAAEQRGRIAGLREAARLAEGQDGFNPEQGVADYIAAEIDYIADQMEDGDAA